MKYVILIADGCADNPVDSLGGMTPLQAADIPNLDRLASLGQMGHVRTIPDGLPPGSDTAILSICGYDPRVYYTGRSPLETAGIGVVLKPGEVSYRCNMVALSPGSFDDATLLSHSGGAIEGGPSAGLLKALLADEAFARLADTAGMRFYSTPSFRHFAVQASPDNDGLVTIPPHDHLGESAARHFPSGAPNAGILLGLMRRAYEVLSAHPINQKRVSDGLLPANGIWFWAPGTAVTLPELPARFGKTGGAVSAVPLIWGIARLAGLDVVHVDGATGELDTNYEGKVAATLDGLRAHNLMLLHVEAPDECTHNGDLDGKLEALRRIDARVVAPLMRGLDAMGEDYRLLALSDHKTLTATRGHDGAPVPFLLYQKGDARGTPARFDEVSGEAGLFVPEGHTLLNLLFQREVSTKMREGCL